MYVPILNLPSVRAKELWRLRPEFGVALRLAMGEKPERVTKGTSGGKPPGEEGKTEMLDEVLTIADVVDDQGSTLQEVFTAIGKDDAKTASVHEKQKVILVDHNAPSIPLPGLSDEVIRSRIDVVGCVDHHVDEGYVSSDAEPRIVRTGIGSCTSLVVQHLRDEGLWPASFPDQENDQGDDDGVRQVARLALAAILIDTSNLKASGDKCSDLDREVVKFLESIVMHTGGVKVQGTMSGEATANTKWDRDAFHEVLSATKTNSLDLLTMQEIFDRDYKSWTEPTAKHVDVNIGISSLVKPLSWLVRHAGGVDDFLDEVERFAYDEERKLGVFAMLTRAGVGKELVLLGLNDEVNSIVDKFEARAGELKLKTWEEDEPEGLAKALSQRVGGQKGAWKIWWMGDTSKSRKQVGPLVREATREV